MKQEVYRYFCRACKNYTYNHRHISICDRCGSSNLRKDRITKQAVKSARRRRRGCCGRR